MRTVIDIQTEIQKLQNEIVVVQSQCPHPTSSIMAYMWRVGAMYPARICDTCQAKLNTITKEEEEKWWADWREQHKVTVGSNCTVQSNVESPK